MVCTANLCRSPIAEQLLRRAVDDAGLAWSVSSAGTRARSGQPMHPRAAAELQRRGVAPADDWSSRRLTRELLEQADLVLTAETEHRQYIVTKWPDQLRHTFLLRHFARLVTAVEAGNPLSTSDLVQRATAALSHVQPATHGEDELADPIRGRGRAFRACAQTVEDAVNRVVARISRPS